MTWNNISIVDPLFTVPVLILIGTAIKTRKRLFSYFAIAWVVYLCLGFVQYDRAFKAANELAILRAQSRAFDSKPSFGNLILWKSIYQHQEKFYVDAIRTVQSSTWCMGKRWNI